MSAELSKSTRRLRSLNHHRTRRGVTAVEFSLAAPVALFLIFAAFEFGRMNMIRHTIQDAAYEAARKGLVTSSTDAAVRNTAASIMSAAGIRSGTTAITQTVADVNVNISVNCELESWLGPVFFKGKSFNSSITLNKR